MIKQFLRDVYWSDLDYLLVDTPPGTSDEHLSIVTYLKEAKPDGVIMVTTPQVCPPLTLLTVQEVALLDVRKEINFCQKVNLPIIGVIENMSVFVCPKCKVFRVQFATYSDKVPSHIFPPTTGGAQKMCEEMNVPFLGSIPLDPLMARSCDEGKHYMTEFPDSIVTKAYNDVLESILQALPVAKREIN